MPTVKTLYLQESSPYSTGFVLNYSDRTFSLERYPLKYVPNVDDQLHIVMDSDSVWSLAYQYYGNSKYYWIIVDMNNLENAFSLVTGQVLVIPDIVRIKNIIT